MKEFLIVAVAIFLQTSGIVTGDCDLRYLKHYDQKHCNLIQVENGCPVRYQCQNIPENMLLKCLHEGKLYSIGERIDEKCESCTCQGNSIEGASIDCAAVDCPDWEAKDKNCYMGYEAGACCPTEMCPSEKERKEKTCRNGEKDYNVGRYVPSDDPCLSCLCTEDSLGQTGVKCTKVHCLTGLYAQQIREGCLSIYGKKSCCITEMYCGGIQGAEPITSPENKDFLCHYRGMYYELGSTVSLSTKQGIECTCKVPPDFTCVRK